MQKSTISTGKHTPKRQGRWLIEFELRKDHPEDKKVVAILDSKKPERTRTQFMRDAIQMMDAAEKGDFTLFLTKFGGQMLMQGLIGTQLQPRIASPDTSIIRQIEPPVTGEDTAAMMFDLLTA